MAVVVIESLDALSVEEAAREGRRHSRHVCHPVRAGRFDEGVIGGVEAQSPRSKAEPAALASAAQRLLRERRRLLVHEPDHAGPVWRQFQQGLGLMAGRCAAVSPARVPAVRHDDDTRLAETDDDAMLDTAASGGTPGQRRLRRVEVPVVLGPLYARYPKWLTNYDGRCPQCHNRTEFVD